MGENNLDVLSDKVDRSIERSFGHIVIHQVKKTVLRLEGSTVQGEGETFLQI